MYLTNLVFSVSTISYRSLFFPTSIYGQHTSHLGHKSRGVMQSVTCSMDCQLDYYEV